LHISTAAPRRPGVLAVFRVKLPLVSKTARSSAVPASLVAYFDGRPALLGRLADVRLKLLCWPVLLPPAIQSGAELPARATAESTATTAPDGPI
jgi:hypothetical protein